MKKIITLIVLVAISIFGFISPVSIQGATVPFYINPGATNSESQNPISPLANFTVIAGNNVTWINHDSSPHMLVSGTPEDGPNNIFYGDFFGPNENYTVLFDKPGVYPYYDPAWSHIRGVITVESPEFTSDQGSTINGSSTGNIDANFAVGSNTTDGFSSNSNDINSSDSGLTSFPSSSSSSLSSSSVSTFPSYTTDNTRDQSSPLSILTSDQALGSIIKKVGPLLGLLMGEGNSTSLSSSSPFSSSSQSNESFGGGQVDNQSAVSSLTAQSSSADQALGSIIKKVGPLLGLLMGGGNSSPSPSSSPFSSSSQSNGIFDRNLTDFANFSTSEIEADQTTNGNSDSIKSQPSTVQNGSLNSTNEEKSKVHDELVDALKKAFINRVDIPVLPSSFIDDGDSYIYVKMNVINSGDENVNASNFVIHYQTGGSIIGESGSESINDGGLFIRVDAGSYNITSEPQEVHYFINSQDVGNPDLMALLKSYSTSYSEGCSGHINNMEVKDCVITKKYTISTDNNPTDTETDVTNQLTMLNGSVSSGNLNMNQLS